MDEDKVQAELVRCGFTAEQQAFAWRWVRREIDLVKQPPEDKLPELDRQSSPTEPSPSAV